VDYVEQMITIPRAGRLSYWLYVTSSDSITQPNDTLVTGVYRPSGQLLRTLRTRNNTTPRDLWIHEVIDVSRLAGHRVTLRYSATTNSSSPTTFYIDDISLK
jgi:kumamolisin